MKSDNRQVLIVSISSLLFFYSTEAICVPRNVTRLVSSPPFNSPPPPQPAACSLSPTSPAPSQPTTPSPLPVSQPPSQSVGSPSVTPTPSNPASPSPTPTSVLHLPSLASSAMYPAIKSICSSTDHPELCLSSISPYLTGKVDPVSVLEMEIKACTHQAQSASAEAAKIAQDPSTPAAKASSLQTCVDNFDDALDNLEQATDAIKTHDIGTINSMLSAVVTDSGSCEDEFADDPSVNSPIANINGMLRGLASNCLAIAALLKW